MNNSAEQKLASFLKLEPGWCGGDGIAFDRETVERARSVLEHFQARWSDAQVFPGPNGEIVVSYGDMRFYDIEVEIDPAKPTAILRLALYGAEFEVSLSIKIACLPNVLAAFVRDTDDAPPTP